MTNFLRAIWLACALLIFSTNSNATHLRAADVVAERTGPKTYEITVTVYTDITTVLDSLGAIPANLAPIEIRNTSLDTLATFNVPRTSIQFIGNGTFENEYVFSYTFPSAGAGYIISYNGINRNNDILNMSAPSQSMALYVETFIFIDAFDPNLNRTPILTVPPIDLASVGQIYTHNPGAFDPDGDSVSFRVSIPKMNVGTNVSGYVDPDDNSFGAGSSFTLNQITGDIIWNTPLIAGEYNVAFIIEEWRNGIRIGFVTRDMQIIVEPPSNFRPELWIPEDTCVSAEVQLVDTVFASDPDGDAVFLSSTSGVYSLATNPANLDTTIVQTDSTYGRFTWTPACEHVRAQPYFITFKAEDLPIANSALATLETWSVQVIGPAPQNLVATPMGNAVQLDWDLYSCSNADYLEIFRSSCDSGNIQRAACTAGVPSDWGFSKIAEVGPTDTLYLDDDGGTGLERGVNYYYLIAAQFPTPSLGQSYASDMVTGSAALDVPVIRGIRVTTTSATNGAVKIDLKKPSGLDTITYPGPYNIRIFRDQGIQTQINLVTPVISYFTAGLSDTTITDSLINTTDTAYTYVFQLISGTDTIGTTAPFSTTWLTSTPGYEQIQLSWTDNVPWEYPDSLIQIVFIDSSGTFEAIDTISGSDTTYLVAGLQNCVNYCFQVQREGVYCHDSITDIVNVLSQQECAIPVDSIPPCSPSASIAPIDCESFNGLSSIENTLTWTKPGGPGCDTEPIYSYRIYRKLPDEDNYQFVATTTDTITLSYTDDSLLSMVQCYVITAVDKSGNESAFSNEVCGDNCEYFELPNVFTPNNSPPNDLLIPIPTPRFVESIQFEVYNRWGTLVYNGNDPQINWNGTDNRGQKISEGVYYYRAIVNFDKLNEEDAQKEFKGWVLLLR